MVGRALFLLSLATLVLAAACSSPAPAGLDAGAAGPGIVDSGSGGDATSTDAAPGDSAPADAALDGAGAADGAGGSCTYNGTTYAVGATFPATDGCNTCTCTAPGSVACTKIFCADAAVDAGYVCPASGTINCMPIVPPANVALCSGPYHAWIVANCPGVKFVY